MSRRKGPSPADGWRAEPSVDSPWACSHCGRSVVHANDGSWWHTGGGLEWVECLEEDLAGRRSWRPRRRRPPGAGA